MALRITISNARPECAHLGYATLERGEGNNFEHLGTYEVGPGNYLTRVMGDASISVSQYRAMESATFAALVEA